MHKYIVLVVAIEDGDEVAGALKHFPEGQVQWSGGHPISFSLYLHLNKGLERAEEVLARMRDYFRKPVIRLAE